MSWTTASDLKQQLLQQWARGNLLRPLVFDESAFPLRLSLKRPTSTDLTQAFDKVRIWAAQLSDIQHIRLEWREARHPVMGVQRLPQAAWVDSLDEALAWLNKRSDAECFKAVLDQTRKTHPVLLAWLGRRPLQAIELAQDWPLLLAVISWMQQHLHPGCYLRQVDVPGVHSKFIEKHRVVLSELFDLALPEESIAGEYQGVNQFSARYGFADKPTRIRFRILDDRIALLPGVTRPDITLDVSSFANLNISVQRVFITENEINFLAFPPLDHAMVIFGAGYGWEALSQAHWLNNCEVYYWGDIDTHGFGILNQLRNRFAHVESFLMDRETLMAHQRLWGEEDKKPLLHDLPGLTAAESLFFDELRDNRIRERLRLEQERVGFSWLQERLVELFPCR